ncbi:hypothetical protein [Nocardia canadensis]|uniref:hypothetical protein n=1 Tax=Nocardia canadensis TaxID=3065238 RepID=UPI00292F1FF0|nr:hypothetical protein [Nocardia canadensis]
MRANKIDHSPTVCLREEQIVDHLDLRLAQVYTPGQIEQPLAILESTKPWRNPEAEAAAAAAHREADDREPNTGVGSARFRTRTDDRAGDQVPDRPLE